MYARWSLSRGDVKSARASRVALRKLLEDAQIPADYDEVDVILGELASNAVRYGTDPMFIEVISQDARLEIRTQDAGHGYDLDEKLAHAAGAESESGRGLRIVRAFADCVSVTTSPEGEFRVSVSIDLEKPLVSTRAR